MAKSITPECRVDMLLGQRRRNHDGTRRGPMAILKGIYIVHDLDLVPTIIAWKQRRLDEIDTSNPRARRGRGRCTYG
jgi:hypothetical protein